jgi:hypothetical protein
MNDSPEEFPVSVEQPKEDPPSTLRQPSSLREVNLLLKSHLPPSSPLIPKPSRPYVKCSFFLTKEDGSDVQIFNARLMEMPRKNDVFLIDNTTFEVVSFTRILAFANEEQDYVKEVKVDVLVRKRPVFHHGNDQEEDQDPSEERRPFQRRYSR